jgi:hypothetical protein
MDRRSHRLLSVLEAAAELGVSARRVQAMAAAGELASDRIGNRLVFDERAVRRRALQPRMAGRPFAPDVAWAVLSFASGRSWAVDDPSLRWRYRARAAELAAAVSGGRFSRRASLHAFRAASRDVEGIRADDLVVLAGVSAAEQYAIDIAAPDVVEAYIDEAALRDLQQRYFLEPADPAAANVLLRVVPANLAAILQKERYAPRAAVALDLLESDDERSRRAGEQALAQLAAAA